MKELTKKEVGEWIKLALKTSHELGSGASRVAFLAGEDYVLKFAPELTGILQQDQEIDVYERIINTNRDHARYFAKILGYSADHRIIIQEAVEETYESQLTDEELDVLYAMLEEYDLIDGAQGGYSKEGHFKIFDMGLTSSTNRHFNAIEDIYNPCNECYGPFKCDDCEIVDKEMPSLFEMLKNYHENGTIIDLDDFYLGMRKNEDCY